MFEKNLNIQKNEIISADGLTVNPAEARLDVSSLCQLDCVLCPVARRNGRPFVGRGVMPLSDFAGFIDSNPQIRLIEIGNSGEVFLNPDLPAILKYAFDKGVIIRIAEGANLNDAEDEALEALVKYKVSFLRVSMDGATQETYRIYRVGGNIRNVLNNVQRINAFKKKYKSRLPRLILQFIPFGHNEHEIKKIAFMAQALDMEVFYKLNVFDGHLPLVNPETVNGLLGYSDKDSYLKKTGDIYMRDICLQLWRAPQVNWDGRLLGCSANTKVTYAANALGDAFIEAVNTEPIKYARKMLMGEAPPRDDIPCVGCDWFADYKKLNRWFSREEVKASMERHHQWICDHED
jgi:MoaA/NifB/PqqE/SkfB family radical SAM enzyme